MRGWENPTFLTGGGGNKGPERLRQLQRRASMKQPAGADGATPGTSQSLVLVHRMADLGPAGQLLN